MASGYLEEEKPRITKVTEEYKEESNREDAKEEPTDSEEEAIKKRAQRKEKSDARTASLAVPRMFCHLPVPRSSTPPPRLSTPPSPSTFGVHVPRSFALSVFVAPVLGSFAPPSPSGCLPVPGLFAPPPRLSAPLSPFASGMRVPGSSAPSASGAPMPGSSTPPSPSGRLPMPGLSAPPPESSAPSSPFASGVRVPRSSAPSRSGRLPVLGPSPLGSFPPFANWLSP